MAASSKQLLAAAQQNFQRTLSTTMQDQQLLDVVAALVLEVESLKADVEKLRAQLKTRTSNLNVRLD